MGAWGETAFENDRALDAVMGYEDYGSIVDEERVRAVLKAFRAHPQRPHRHGYGQEEAYAACELVVIALAADDGWRQLPYSHAIEEEVEKWLPQHPYFSSDDVNEALLVIEQLLSEENLSPWQDQDSRREKLTATSVRLTTKRPAADFAAEVQAGPRRRPSAISDGSLHF